MCEGKTLIIYLLSYLFIYLFITFEGIHISCMYDVVVMYLLNFTQACSLVDTDHVLSGSRPFLRRAFVLRRLECSFSDLFFFSYTWTETLPCRGNEKNRVGPIIGLFIYFHSVRNGGHACFTIWKRATLTFSSLSSTA